MGIRLCWEKIKESKFLVILCVGRRIILKWNPRVVGWKDVD